MEKIKKLYEMISECENIVFFGGAGVSTESNIPDFRSADGLYHKSFHVPPEQVVSHTFFWNETEMFFEFYKNNMMYLDAKPNKAHIGLAELERKGKIKSVITQNIDGLHQLAGSKKVLELHGSIHRNYCQKCGKFYDATFVKNATGIPKCTCGGVIKPDVVLYGETLDANVISQTIQEISNADMLIIGGTSLMVYPAASFIDYFQGKYMVVINKGATSRDQQADLCINDRIAKVFHFLKNEEK